MPNQNGKGPLGQGPANGRRRGFCRDQDLTEARPGLGRGRGILCRRAKGVQCRKEETARLEENGAG